MSNNYNYNQKREIEKTNLGTDNMNQ